MLLIPLFKVRTYNRVDRSSSFCCRCKTCFYQESICPYLQIFISTRARITKLGVDCMQHTSWTSLAISPNFAKRFSSPAMCGSYRSSTTNVPTCETTIICRQDFDLLRRFATDFMNTVFTNLQHGAMMGSFGNTVV